MAKLYYKYGTMDSTKSAELLMAVHKYESKGDNILVFKPNIDTRSSLHRVESRTGMSHPCSDIDKNFDFINSIDKILKNNYKIDTIFIDECQWLTLTQIKQLCYIVDNFNIPVLCYGLKNSYVKDELLEGAKYLLYYADSIEEIKNVCQFCKEKATMNLRIVDDKPIYKGNTTHVGDTKATEDYYIPVCREHYFNPIIDTK